METPVLKPGGTIGVMAPSSYVERTDIEKSAALLETRGYKVFIHPQTFERHNQSAGTVLQKTMAFQGLWQRADIDAIWCAGGGNRALQLLDSINFKKLVGNPKPLIGFSDVTALLNAVYAHTGMITYHGPVFKNIHRYEQLDHLLDLLANKATKYPMQQAKTLTAGKAEGPLIGGNLSLFQYLPNTLPGNFYKGALLFLEDNAEELSRFDRMMIHLKRLGVFSEISGLILGEFTDLTDTGRPFGFSFEDIIREHTEDLDIPIVTNVPFGHGKNLYTLPLGATAKLTAAKNKITLSF